MFSFMDKMHFDDNLGYTLPFATVSGMDELGCHKVEVTELSPTGDVVDVMDVDSDELGKLSASFKIKGLKSIVDKAKNAVNSLPKYPTRAINALRLAKSLPIPAPKRRLVAIPKTSHSSLFAGTNSRLSTIASLLKKQSLSKSITNEHKAKVKRDTFRKQVLKRLANIEGRMNKSS